MAEDRLYEVGIALKTKGGAVSALKGAERAASTLGDKMRSLGTSTEAWGRSMLSSSLGAARAYAGLAAKMGGAGIAATAGLAAAKGFEFQTSMEAARNSVAGTLQMFNHSAGAADQLGTNIKVAEASMARLIDIANKSPGELKDVQQLFQNMLPGARSVTGNMERILKLSQGAAMFTPTFGGDFALVGNQISRMMTGGAGAEMETWRTLQSAILDVGQNMKKTGSSTQNIFSKTQQMGEKLTMEFNNLAGEDRLRLLEAVFQRGGAAMQEMFATSWEGASSTFVSGWRQIAAAGTRPMYEATKKALIKATSEGGVFDENAVKRMQNAAESVGMHFGKMAEKGFARIEGAIAYLDKNWQKVANSAYHAFQIGAGLIKGAFAFGFAKMVAGAAITAASMGVRGARGAVRGVAAVGRAGAAGIGAAKSAVGFVKMVAEFGSIAGMATAAASGLAVFGLALLPIAAIALAAGAALGAFAVVAVGIGAYIASEWDALLGSIKQGFADGTLTVRPLVEQALLLWERLKLVGAALIGGTTGADMFQGAMMGAVGVVDMLGSAVAMLAELAADFMDFVSSMKATLSGEGGTGHRYDKAELERREAIGALDGMQKRTLAQLRAQESTIQMLKQAGQTEVARGIEAALGTLQGSEAKVWKDRAARMREAAGAMDKLSLKDLNFEDVDRYTKQLEQALTGGDEDGKKNKPRGASVNIGTLNIIQDLRNEDPDRIMMAFVQPLTRIAAMPAGGTIGPRGF